LGSHPEAGAISGKNLAPALLNLLEKSWCQHDRPANTSSSKPGAPVTDWLATLREQAKVGEQMAAEVSRMLSNPDISLQQVSRLYNALEQQAQFTEKLARMLEERGHDFTVVEAAEALEELFNELAASAAGKVKQLNQ
jgi:hypothetical protein